MNEGVSGASFRDPAGFVFFKNGECFRQINKVYLPHYDRLVDGGLYKKLTDNAWLIPQEEASLELALSPDAGKIVKPDPVFFISYPYEWSFSQLKDAALLTLSIQRTALENGFWLKDANPYNIQFHRGKPILIDALSFEILPPGKPWPAYLQFCRQFLAPLALMSKRNVRLNQLLRDNLEGIPLDLASALLPGASWLNPGLLTHLHLHAKYQQKHANRENQNNAAEENAAMALNSLMGFVDNLKASVKALKWKPEGTEWGGYYSASDHLSDYLERKLNRVKDYLQKLAPKSVWDLGANVGTFSRLASDMRIPTVSFDIDPACVELNYLKTRDDGDTRLLPLLMDLNNPTPALGWGNQERMSLWERGPADTFLALALVHHLAISNNLPLEKIANLFHRSCQSLIVEFVPKSDPKVQTLLSSRPDIFDRYTREEFESQFRRYFEIVETEVLAPSERVLYMMRKK